MSRRLHWIILGAALAVGLGIGVVISVAHSSTTPSTPVADTQTPETANPNLDPGARLDAVAPNFTLTDQFGKRVSLRSLRGKVVVLSFNDPECTTICPLTTTAMLRAKQLLGPAASKVALIGIGANPEKTQVKWVRAYSKAHGMLHKWRFLTGSLPELRRVWRSYYIAAAVVNGAIDHTPATYVIGPTGVESRLYQTQMAYSSVNQLGYELAQSISALLPEHPRLRGKPASLDRTSPPRSRPAGDAAGGRRPQRSPRPRLGGAPRPVLRHVGVGDHEPLRQPGVAQRLREGRGSRAPAAASSRSTRQTSRRRRTHSTHFLRSLPHHLAFPVAIDATGTVADGYRVQDSPWLELVSGKGRFLFYEDLAVKDWPTLEQLVTRVRAAQAK